MGDQLRISSDTRGGRGQVHRSREVVWRRLPIEGVVFTVGSRSSRSMSSHVRGAVGFRCRRPGHGAFGGTMASSSRSSPSRSSASSSSGWESTAPQGKRAGLLSAKRARAASQVGAHGPNEQVTRLSPPRCCSDPSSQSRPVERTCETHTYARCIHGHRTQVRERVRFLTHSRPEVNSLVRGVDLWHFTARGVLRIVDGGHEI